MSERRLTVVLDADTTRFAEHMRRVAEHLARLRPALDRWDRTHPRRLSIDGHAYRRRQLARRRRR